MERLVTFGCRLNIFESEVIKNKLNNAQINEDIIVFNTCSVTEEAEKQVIKEIKKTKRLYPDKKIIVTGCSAQINPDMYSSMAEVSKVLGNQEKFIAENYDLKEKSVLVSNIMEVKELAGHLVENFEYNTRAFLQIQNGCNHRCTFCIIPFARGNSRSVAIGDIVSRTKTLVQKGYNEIVLTGVDTTDYGLDLPGKPSLGSMLKRLLKLTPDLPRLRLSSIDVAEIDSDLMDLILYEPRFMPHLHISLQAGDNMILKRMKRRHTREQVVEFCNQVRSLRKNIAFGADIIAGFPTETDEMFENTFNLISEAKLQYLHVFPYSIRKNTPAARMPQIEIPIKKKRAKLLRDAGEKELNLFSIKSVGSRVKALVEKNNIARSENFLKLHLNNLELKVGDIINCEIIAYHDKQLYAKVL